MKDQENYQLELNFEHGFDLEKIQSHNLIFKNPESAYHLPFEIAKNQKHHQELQDQKNHAPKNADNHKRSLKEIIQDAGRQIFASFLILIIGFLLLNFSAYSKIVINKWNQFWDLKSPLNQLVEENPIVYSKEILQATTDPEIQKKQIPALNLQVSPSDNRIVIPRINQNIPIVKVSSENLIKRDWAALELDLQEALRSGVVHYPGTSLPGQTGNTVITGHSSYFPWDPGRFKDVFASLHDVVVGDKLVVYYEQDKYVYEITDKKIVLPENIDVLKQTPEDKITLITCSPVGTNLKRLIVTAKPISKNGVEIVEKLVR